MKTWHWCAALLGLPAFLTAHGVASDPGGRDVTVALFTTHSVRAVIITPLTTDAWVAVCAKCSRKPLTIPLTISSGETYAGGTLRVADKTDAAISATASGLWHLRQNPQGMDVVLAMPSERYAAAVVSAESAADEPAESLKGLAIVARTYALNGSHYAPGTGHLPADLCDSTQCQAIRLGPVSQPVLDAVSATAGETLWFHGRRAEVFFSQHCGGQTEDVTEAWSSNSANAKPRAEPYLTSHADPFCVRQGTAAWHATVSLDELRAISMQQGWHLPSSIANVSIAQRTHSGRVSRLLFRGTGGDTSIINAGALRFAVGRTLGWNRIRSDLYEVALRDNALVFDGRGHGHGVGFCQAGATEMARERRTARAILAFYFPGTSIRITPNDDGWIETPVGTLTVRSSSTLSSKTHDDMARAWQDAMQRFPVGKPPEPVVIITPSTELFRQMTAQPGWDLASTRSNVVTLQPEYVLHTPGGRDNEERTLQHEFLHVLIESEATGRAPLWLREGLTEVLAGDALPLSSHTTETGPQLDKVLKHADSAHAAAQAHVSAGARVQLLIARYGLSSVRGWLRSGVPAAIAAGR